MLSMSVSQSPWLGSMMIVSVVEPRIAALAIERSCEMLKGVDGTIAGFPSPSLVMILVLSMDIF